MRSTRIVLLTALALLVGVAAAAGAVALVGDDGQRAADTTATGASEPLSGPEVGFSGTDITTGAVAGLGKLEGRPVVVTVWASWCPACLKQVEALRAFAASHEEAAFLAAAACAQTGPQVRIGSQRHRLFGKIATDRQRPTGQDPA